MRKKLDRITMVIIDTVNYGKAVNAIQKSLEQIEPARTIFFTDIELNINLPVEFVKIPPLGSKAEYSHFVIKELWRYIETDFVLIIQHDGYVLNGESWDDKFYDADYIGASWLESDGWNVGNGGFSLRSQRLQAILGNDSQIQIWHPEDNTICRIYRAYLEVRDKIKFANDDLADHFSFELRFPIYNTFGFHGNFHEPFKETIMVTRQAAGGDVIALEPLLHYYYKKGYRVVLNTMQPFINYFLNHYFRIYQPQEMDGRSFFKEINLDLAYEVFPKQLHLKSYYDMCGITDGEIRNPRLSAGHDHKKYKVFDKYVVLHLDKRPQASRNIEGIDWATVVKYLNENGYDVIQVGVGFHEKVKGAVFMNTVGEVFLMSVIGGADLFIGIDSMPSNIAVAMDTKAIIFSGSVDLRHIIPDMTNVIWVHNHDKKVCDQAFCWHNTNGCEGTKCYIDDDKPPCNQFSTSELLTNIKTAINGI
jgi:ADP-heptose:LPS heptosyltransferase